METISQQDNVYQIQELAAAFLWFFFLKHTCDRMNKYVLYVKYGKFKMKQMTATEAAKGFGQLVDEAQAEPITIEKNGRPVAVIYSYRESQEIEALKLAELKRFVAEGINDSEAGRVQPLTKTLMEDIKARGRNSLKESQN
jgi:prevent-host-death family protein